MDISQARSFIDIFITIAKMGIKGHSAMHLTIAKMTMKFIYRMSTNSSVYEYIKFCVIFMERDILLLTSTKHT